MAPLPPTPKITEISCISNIELVPFVDGWDEERCPVEASEVDFYATIFFKGDNLTKEWLTQAIKGAYHNGGSENEATLGDIYIYDDGVIAVDFNFNFPFGEGESVQFDIAGVKSAWMPMYKAN